MLVFPNYVKNYASTISKGLWLQVGYCVSDILVFVTDVQVVFSGRWIQGDEFAHTVC